MISFSISTFVIKVTGKELVELAWTMMEDARNSSGRALNRYEDAHKTRKECVLAPTCLAKSHRDAILASREGLAELLRMHNICLAA